MSGRGVPGLLGMAAQHSMVRRDQNVFLAPTDGHSGYPQSSSIVNKAVMTNLTNKSFCTQVNTSVG